MDAELIEIARMELFGGEPKAFGGLSNERELVAYVPAEFRRFDNPWTKAASRVFFKGADPSAWSFRTPDANERRDQLTKFRAVLTGWDLSHEAKEALAGWMLSEMLTEVPK